MSSRASAAHAARTLAGHAVRRLTDESTNRSLYPPAAAGTTFRKRPDTGLRSWSSTRYGGRPMVAPAPPCARWPRSRAAALLALAAAGCGDDDSPVEVRLKEETAKQTVLGFPALATKNTTRVGGEDPTRRRRRRRERRLSGRNPRLPPAGGDARGQRRLARRHRRGRARRLRRCARRSCSPTASDIPRRRRPRSTRSRPTGARALGGAQAVEVGEARAPDSLRARRVGREGPVHARRRDRRARDRRRRAAVAERPDRVERTIRSFAMPAAAWAAKSGDAVLFTERDELPARDPPGDPQARASGHLRPRPAAGGRRSAWSASCGGSAACGASPGAGRSRTPSPSRATRTPPSAGGCATRATAWWSRTRTAPSTRPRERSLCERQVRSAAAGRGRRRPARAARELPARHPARLPVRPRPRGLQPRLADGRRVGDQRRRAGAHRRAERDRAHPRRGPVTARQYPSGS